MFYGLSSTKIHKRRKVSKTETLLWCTAKKRKHMKQFSLSTIFLFICVLGNHFCTVEYPGAPFILGTILFCVDSPVAHFF